MGDTSGTSIFSGFAIALHLGVFQNERTSFAMPHILSSFKTARLELRPPVPEDAPCIFDRYAQDPEVCRYMSWRPHTSIQDTHRFLEGCARERETGYTLSWAITLPGTPGPIGMITCRPERYKADIGYVLARAYWGNGYMSEAVHAVVDRTLADPNIFRVWAVCDVDNHGSARVLEKAGMTFEGTLHRWIMHPNVSPKPRDCHVYARVV